MTDRLAELQQGHSLSSGSPEVVDDIEAGLRSEQDAVLAKFNREADAIDKVYVWADKSIRTVQESLSNPDALPKVRDQLDVIEQKLDAVRVRLKRIASENKDLAAAKSSVPSSLRIRVARYTKLGKDFMATTSKLENAREAHKKVIARGVKTDVLRANPAASEAQVDRAIETGGDLESVLTADHTVLAHQIDDLRARNMDIQNLSKNIVELHQMFTDMSILVDGQQELINDIEYNVKEVKTDTKKAGEELLVARRHQKSARKKKICIVVLLIVIVVVIVLAVIIPMAVRNNWFSGGSSSDSSSATPSPASGAQSRRNSNDIKSHERRLIRMQRYN